MKISTIINSLAHHLLSVFCASEARKHPAAPHHYCDAAMSYSLRLARCIPSTCLCSGDSASRGGVDDGEACTVTYKDDSLSTAIYCEGSLPPLPSFLSGCMNQPENSVSFGTPVTLKSFYNTTESYKKSLDRTLATVAFVLLT